MSGLQDRGTAPAPATRRGSERRRRRAVRAGSRTSNQASSPMRVVDASLCSHFPLNGVIVSGCVGGSSAKGSAPWCMVGREKVLCKKETIPARAARLTMAANGDTVQCDPFTKVPNVGLVHGCYAIRPGGHMMCNSGNRGLLSCLTTNATQETNKADSSSDKPSGPGNTVPIIVGAVCGAVALLVGAFFLYRWYRSRNGNAVSPANAKKASKPKPQTSPSAAGRGEERPVARLSSVYTGPDSSYEQPIGKYVIAESYKPELDDEIPVRPGDVVLVYENFDDGWCSGMNVTRGTARGVFPTHCIDDERGRID